MSSGPLTVGGLIDITLRPCRNRRADRRLRALGSLRCVYIDVEQPWLIHIRKLSARDALAAIAHETLHMLLFLEEGWETSESLDRLKGGLDGL